MARNVSAMRSASTSGTWRLMTWGVPLKSRSVTLDGRAVMRMNSHLTFVTSAPCATWPCKTTR
jgi:hypothetical protein